MDETLELIKQAQSGDASATERLVEENTGLVWSVVRRFLNRGYEAEDLFQIGSIGLLKCIQKFNMDFDVRFSTYAVPMIMGEIKRFIRDDGMIKVSRPIKELALKAKYMQESLTHQNGRPPTVSELAKNLNANVEDLVMAMETNHEIGSLYQTINQGDGSSDTYLIDKLVINDSADSSIVDTIALKQIINNLEPKERQVIIMRYFQDKTQTEVAKAIGVSQVQVSRMEKRVLSYIRESF